jgi:Asp-tRNA(Asn)/Glu-tRNA(Gln) amidotransferase A subunit family amidase
MTSLFQLSLTEMLRKIQSGEAASWEIWESCRRQIDLHDVDIHAWQEISVEPVDKTAVSAPLMGLPIGVKDTFDVLGMRAERGSPIWHGRVPQEDAAVVSRLKALGARVMGKTVTTEFAYFTPGVTANPHSLTHTPGGSSSGSAAAVASGMVPVALGSQTAASVIRPAAYCGVAGYVSTAGEHSLRGVMPLAHTLDSLGMLARDVTDLQLLQALLSSPEQVPDDSLSCKPLAILVIDGTDFGTVDDSMRNVLERSVDDLISSGVAVDREDGALLGPEGGAMWALRHRQLMAYEAAQTLAFEYVNRSADLSPSLSALIEEGRAIDADLYVKVKRERDLLRQRLEPLMGRYDAILAPAAPGVAPEGLGATGRPDQSRVWQLLGVPQVTLPAAWSTDGLPFGLQLVGAIGADRRLLQTARWLQDELGWRSRIPGVYR